MKIKTAASAERLRPASLLLGTALFSLFSGAAFAETLTVTDVSTSSPYSLTIPTVEVVDGNIDEATVRGLFSGDPAALQALSTLTATSVNIPELTYTQPAAGEMPASTTTYRDLKLENIANGIAATTSVGGAEASAGEMFSMTFGGMSVSNFNIGGLLGFYGFGAGAAEATMTQVYSDFTFEGGTFNTADVLSCTFGGATGGDFSARPLRTNMADANAAIMELDAAQTAGTPPNPETVKKVVLFYTDILTAFSTTPVAFAGFNCDGKDDKGNAMLISSGPIDIGGFEPAIYPNFSMNDFRIEVATDGFINFGNFTWKRMDFSDAIATLEAATTFDEAYFIANWRKLVPVLDGFSLSNLNADLPDEQNPGQRVVASLGSVDATLGNYINGIPADIALSVGNLTVPLNENMKDLPVADLIARGITQLDVSLGTQLKWNQESSTIDVNEVLIDLGALGKVLLSGTFGNATDTLFSDNTETALMAAQMLTLKDITIELEDRGIGSIIYANAAREAGQSEPAFRTALAGMAQGMTMAFLGNTPEALNAAAALGTFMNGTPNLKMTITAVDPAGIGLAELSQLETNPTALVGKVTVVAEASGEPVAAPATEAPATEGPTSTEGEKLDLKAQPQG